jgi:uncharacterized protein (DUF362 family)
MQTMNEPSCRSSRRLFLRQAAGALGFLGTARLRAAGLAGAEPVSSIPGLPPLEGDDRSASAPSAPVAIARCRDFDVKNLAAALDSLCDQIGGIKKLVAGKTVTVKLNTTGHGKQRLRGVPAERSYQTHPAMVEVLCGILAREGAKRIYLVESLYETKRPEEVFAAQGWNIERLVSAGNGAVAFEDTRNQGAFKDYVKLPVPWRGYVFPAYHLNRRYADTDVFVTVAKLKNHVTAGITGAVKNLFGITPTALYGNDAPNERTTENRGSILHDGSRAVPAGVTPERYASWKDVGKAVTSFYRVPRVTADVYGVRPADLAIVEGVETCQGGEGPWCPRVRPIAPGIILAGRNAVTVDAIATAVMGYDPLASVTKKPWFGDNHLALLARAGVGTIDPARIEVAGVPLKDALHEFEPGLNGWVKRHL